MENVYVGPLQMPLQIEYLMLQCSHLRKGPDFPQITAALEVINWEPPWLGALGWPFTSEGATS